MREFCDSLMKLNPNFPYGEDYSAIAFAFFLQEQGMIQNKKYKISLFTTYIYRFYSDINVAREKHYYKLINELWHYEPMDLYDYSKSVLEYIASNTGLIVVGETEFVLVQCPEDIINYMNIVNNIIQTLAAKFLGNEYRMYTSQISEEEYVGKKIFGRESRVFFRALENINYCFISDETDLSKLQAVQLKEKDEFDSCNYLILNKEYAKQYEKKELVIRKNGYPYVNGKRQYEHLEISVLKKLRSNLLDI